MKQRLGIAAALLRAPRLLLLDEPATGLDPAGMRDMRALVRRLASEGMTVLLSSHLLTEVDELCNRVAIVRRGRMIYEGDLAQLKAGAGASYRLETTDDLRARRIAREHAGVRSVRDEAEGLIVEADAAAVAPLTIALGGAGIGVVALVPQTATLERLFFELTEGGAAGGRAGESGFRARPDEPPGTRPAPKGDGPAARRADPVGSSR
jgi:ABC-2 type transport system ATP-binding protein